MPVCLAAPRSVSGLADIVGDPVYATAVGLLLYGRDQEMSDVGRRRGFGGGVAELAEKAAERVAETVKGWFQERI